ncbi:MAG: sulfur oxidation c-type cytochrome SoxX [Hyphomicrobiales bacterium]
MIRSTLVAGVAICVSVAFLAGMQVATAQEAPKADAPKQAAAAPAKPKKKSCRDGQSEQVAAYKVTKGEHLPAAIEASLTGKPGDPEAGVNWMVHRRLGNCIACHEISAILKKSSPDNIESMIKYAFHGKIGPSLDGVASRYSTAEIRMIVVDPKKSFPDADTIMPSFQRVDGLHKVNKDCSGIAMLTPQQVEDVVAFLSTLKE